MMGECLLLVDDWGSLWEDESWEVEIENLRQAGWVIVTAGPFYDQSGIALVKKELANKYKGASTKPESIYVVTDSDFSGNHSGGADLLKQLQNDDAPVWHWKRAVIYSIEPERRNLPINRVIEVSPDEGARGIKRAVRFLKDGEDDNAQLPDVSQLLYNMHLSIDAAKREQVSFQRLFPVRASYGVASEPNVGRGTHSPFDGFVSYDRSKGLRFFDEAFVNWLASYCGYWDPKARDKLMLIIHPFASLERSSYSSDAQVGPSSLRVLWELIQTGGDSALMHAELLPGWGRMNPRAFAPIRKQYGALQARVREFRRPEDVDSLLEHALNEVEEAQGYNDSLLHNLNRARS